MPRSFRLPFRSRRGIVADIDEELETHLAIVAAQLRAQGWTPPDAEAEARRRFGDLEYTRHYCRAEDLRREKEKRQMAMLDETRQDLRYVFRAMRSAPAFTLVALATLALGIGANTAIFSVVRAVLLEPLPFANADRIVRVWHSNAAAGIVEGSFSEPDFLDVRHDSRLAESIGGYFFTDGGTGIDLTGDGNPERLACALVAPGFFETLRPRALLGRVIAGQEYDVGHNQVAVISEALWRRRFSSDPNIVGKSITLNAAPFTVVGVMGTDFTYPAAQVLDVWIPLSYFGPDAIGRERPKHFISAIARVKPGVTPEQFRAEVAGIVARLARTYPDNPGWDNAAVRTIRESIVGDVRRPLVVLLAAVAMVLLITCVNIAALLLARATARQRELAVRAALGAGRGRIIRQLLTESLALALLGGVIGVALAYVALRVLVTAGGAELPGSATIGVDGVVLAFTFGVSVIAGVIFGALPAIRAASPSLEQTLRSGTRGSGTGARTQRLRGALVVTEVALAVILVAGAGLATKSFSRLVSVRPGFQPHNALIVRMSVPGRYETPAQRSNYYESILTAVRAVPGVVAAGSVRDLPTRGNGEMVPPENLGLPVAKPGTAPVQLHHISSDFFKAMGIPLRGGREFRSTDRAGAPLVLIANEALARRFWPGENIVNKTIRVGTTDIQIIGVVGDVRQRGLSEAVEPTLFIHALQNFRSGMSIVIRTTGAPLALANPVRAAIWSVDRNQTIAEVTTMENVLGVAVSRPKLLAWLLGVFGGIGLLLGALGIYGLLVFVVAQRRQEIGVRVALGASPRSVLRLIVGQGMSLALGGVFIGIIVARLLTRQMQSVLFGIAPSDVATFVQVVVVLLGTAMLASWLPARRALAIDPVTALRYD